jgi:hypothetical protein
MIKSLKDIFRGLRIPKVPRFQYLQVEVTTRCDLPGCLMCPRRRRGAAGVLQPAARGSAAARRTFYCRQ